VACGKSLGKIRGVAPQPDGWQRALTARGRTRRRSQCRLAWDWLARRAEGHEATIGRDQACRLCVVSLPRRPSVRLTSCVVCPRTSRSGSGGIAADPGL